MYICLLYYILSAVNELAVTTVVLPFSGRVHSDLGQILEHRMMLGKITVLLLLLLIK